MLHRTRLTRPWRLAYGAIAGAALAGVLAVPAWVPSSAQLTPTLVVPTDQLERDHPAAAVMTAKWWLR